MKNLITIFDLLLFPFSFFINCLKEIPIQNLNLRKTLLVFISIFISTSTYAVELVNEQFTSNINGWSISGNVSYDTDYDGSMFIDGNGNNRNNNESFENRAWKTYSFGSSYANQTLDVEVRWCATNDWESSSDYLRTRINDSTDDTDYDGGGCQSRTFTADADSNGDFKIEFSTYVSQDVEDAWIDWFTVNGTPITPIGCDNSLDTSANSTSPYTIVTTMHNITSSTSKCISGSTSQADGTPEKEDNYYFTVGTSGTLDVTTLSPNGHDYHLRIGTSAGDTTYYGDTTAEVHNVPTINLSAGDTVYFYFKETGNNEDHYQITFDFVAANTTPPPPNICTGVPGLNGDYYNTNNFTGSIQMSRIDSDINFEWGYGNPGGGVNDNDFSIEWTGTIYFPEDADYIFSLAHDDVMTLIIDGTTIYNNSTWTGGSNNFNDTSATHFAAGTYPITIRFVEWGGGAYAKLAWRNNGSLGSATIIPSTNLCAQTPPSDTLEAVNDYFSTAANTSLAANMFTNDLGTGFTLDSANVSSLQGILTALDTTTGAFTFEPTTNFVGSTSFTYTISDGTTTSTATVQIDVTSTTIEANDDTYDTNPGVSVRGNLLINDIGVDIEYTSITNPPSLGSVTVQSTGDFTYTPTSGVSGTDTFTYLITDAFGSTDEANVTITIGTDYTTGSTRAFELINPDYSRNVIGDYKIAGNTVLCLTEQTSGYGGTCTNNQWNTSNNYVSKYLDIDSESGTWNSTSSYINFDAPYEPTRGIVWAGLFWGGRISTDDTYSIRYAVENGSNSFSTIEVGEGSNVNSIDIETTGATNIKLKIDNGNYTDVLASTFHISPSSGGETYAAYADVSSVLQSANLDIGKHVFTVANLTTMEGREGSPGAFGGWSLVVIYGEGYEFGKPRNISIYNGFIDIGTNNDPIEITGFKLPETGDVSAQLSVFSGEGEYLYGRTTNSNNEDWMKISDQRNSGYDYMPGKTAGTHLGNRDNMFDATLDGILRDSITGEFNDLSSNNVGVDIDNYDVSDLMTAYRTNNADLQSVYIQMYSNNDYITPSMMAFSAELYVPELCYDYALDIDGYVLPSVNNEITTHFGGFGQPLTTALYLKSLEGDLDLSNVNVNYHIRDTSQLTYNDCTTEISETGEFDYSDACLYTHDATLAGFGMYIGRNKTAVNGGIISAFEDRYIKFESDFHTSSVNTGFEFSVDYTVDYGSGAVPLHKIFTPADLCPPTSQGFLPEMGYFNVTDITNDIDEWNLYTQVSRRPFNLRLYAYDFDAGEYLTPIGHDLNLSLEVEVIRADNFYRDANTACNDEHSALTDVAPKFIHFSDGDGRYIDFSYDADDFDFAYRSAAMRVWYLTDVDNNGILVDNHNCTRENQTECVELYTSQYTGDTTCTNECRAIASSGNCYDCLRSHYGRKVCSRDNFAIRPESFITQIYDSNQSNDTRDPSNRIANSIVTASEFALVSGYNYRFDINTTSHVNDIATPRYIQHFEPGSPTHYAHMNWSPDAAHPNTALTCNDVEDKNITLNIFNGSTINPITYLTYTDAVDQIGQYRFEIYDQNWTSADWNPDEMLHHQAGSTYANYYKTGADCIGNSDLVQPTGVNDRQGCTISSVHTNPDTGTEYKYLYAQYYPYAFDVSNLTFGARPDNDGSNNAFVYINTPDLNLYPNGIDENMSYNIQGTFTAVGRTGGRVSNFVENCYADSVDMSLYQNYNHTEPATEPYLSYDLIDFNTTDTSNIIRPRENGIFSHSNIDTTDPLVPLVIPQAAQYFKKDMNGSLTMDLGYNFARQMNVALNPRHINMKDFNLTYTAPPPGINVDLETDHKIFGTINIDQNVTFLFGRAKPAQTYYETIENNINTPLSTVVYCDLGYTECQNRGIMALFGQTNEATWWKSWDHTTPQDGNIELVSAPTSALNTTSVTINSEGEDSTINVNNGGVAPLLVPVNLVVNDPTNPPAPANYTDRWLIYNEYSATTPPIPFYRVKFLGASGWVGKGDTGHVVGDDVNTKNNKRLEW